MVFLTVFRERFSDVSRKFQEGFLKKFQGCLKKDCWVLGGSFKGISKRFQGFFERG